MAKHELFIYGDIFEDSFFERSVSAQMVIDDLATVPQDERVLVRIKSSGGDVFEAGAIFTALSLHKGGVDVQIDSVAASSASYIAMVGETVTIADGAMMMIHNAEKFTFGDDRTHTKAARLLKDVNENVTRAYAARSTLTDKEVAAAMDEETWYTSARAVEAGLADKVLDTLVVEDFKIPAVFGYKNVPQRNRELTKDQQDAGFKVAVKAGRRGFSSVSARSVEIELTRLRLKE